ncbi:LamG domain-containing protein [bacterium]|nr:LamG domain-containing protein [bacterium]MBU1852671.1 LamG domain-containing protein [Candidatus Omnitrophota bacterium]
MMRKFSIAAISLSLICLLSGLCYADVSDTILLRVTVMDDNNPLEIYTASGYEAAFIKESGNIAYIRDSYTGQDICEGNDYNLWQVFSYAIDRMVIDDNNNGDTSRNSFGYREVLGHRTSLMQVSYSLNAEEARGGNGYCIQLEYESTSDYDAQFARYTHYFGDGISHVELSGQDFISFWIKGDTAEDSGPFSLTLWSGAYASVYMGDYLPEGRITTEWQQVHIPLNAFFAPGYSFPENMDSWANFSFEIRGNEVGIGSGTYFIDDLEFSYGSYPDAWKWWVGSWEFANLGGYDFILEKVDPDRWLFHYRLTDPTPSDFIDIEFRFYDYYFDVVFYVLNNCSYEEEIIHGVRFPMDIGFTSDNIDQVILPIVDGVAIQGDWFGKGENASFKYQGGVSSDFVGIEDKYESRLAIYTLEPDPLEHHPAELTLDGEHQYNPLSDFHHIFFTHIDVGESWQSPVVRFRVGSTIQEALTDYSLENGFSSLPTLEEKCNDYNPYLFERLSKSPLLKIDMLGAGQESYQYVYGTLLPLLPEPSIAHLVTYWEGGFDNNYPDYVMPGQSPNPSFGTEEDFIDIFTEHDSTQQIMPYTNPTWWDYNSEIYGINGDDLIAKNLSGYGVMEKYNSSAGFVTSPYQIDVQNRILENIDYFSDVYPSNLLFQDQLAARGFFHDIHPSAPDFLSYGQGWIENAVYYATEIPLYTEDCFDRLVSPEVGFCGTYLKNCHPNLNVDRGKVDMWVQPNWGSSDTNPHTFWYAHKETYNKNSIYIQYWPPFIEFVIYDAGGTLHRVGYTATHQAGDWLHVEARWYCSNTDEDEYCFMSISENGSVRDDSSTLWDSWAYDFGSLMTIGNNGDGGQPADAIIDDLRIYETELGEGRPIFYCSFEDTLEDEGGTLPSDSYGVTFVDCGPLREGRGVFVDSQTQLRYSTNDRGFFKPYPVAMLLYHDKVAFYQHNLHNTNMSKNKYSLSYNAVFGINHSLNVWSYYDEYGQKNEDFSAPLRIADGFQKSFLSRVFGQEMEEFEYVSGENKKVILTSFGEGEDAITVIGNFNPDNTYNYPSFPEISIAPEGFLAVGEYESLVAGIFNGVFNGESLSSGDHYLVIERKILESTPIIEIAQLYGESTELSIDISDWDGDLVGLDAITEEGSIIPTSFSVDGDIVNFYYENVINNEDVLLYRLR